MVNAGIRGQCARRGILGFDSNPGIGMAYLTHEPPARPHASKRRAGASPLTAPVFVFAAVTVIAAAYVAYVLWPRWPDSAVALDAPSLPIIVAGVYFNIDPAAIRMSV